MFYDKLPELGYEEEQSIVIQVAKGADDRWAISDGDMTSIDELIVYYP